MPTLDDDFGYIDPNTVPPYQTAIRYGLMGGLITVIYTLIANMTGLSTPSGGMMTMVLVGLISIIIYVAVIVMGVRHHRDNELGGYISLGRVVIIGIIIALVSGLMGALFNYVYIQFIDPTFIDTMIEGMEEMMSGYGLDEDQLEEALSGVAEGFTPMSLLKNALVSAVLVGGIVSLIVGAIMSKKRD